LNIHTVYPWVIGLKLFYAFGTGNRTLAGLVASISKLKCGAHTNPCPLCGKLNAHVGMKTAECGTRSIRDGCQLGFQSCEGFYRPIPKWSAVTMN
jgi:hypothetical protein